MAENQSRLGLVGFWKILLVPSQLRFLGEIPWIVRLATIIIKLIIDHLYLLYLSQSHAETYCSGKEDTIQVRQRRYSKEIYCTILWEKRLKPALSGWVLDKVMGKD